MHSANRGRVQNKISGFERRVEKSCLKGNWIELLSSVKWDFQLEREKCKRKINEMFCVEIFSDIHGYYIRRLMSSLWNQKTFDHINLMIL